MFDFITDHWLLGLATVLLLLVVLLPVLSEMLRALLDSKPLTTFLDRTKDRP